MTDAPDGPSSGKLPAVDQTPKKKPAALPETTEGFPWMSNHEVKKESNPFTDRDWRMFSYAWTGMLVRVLLIFGGLFSVYQFLVNREEKRVERTLQLVELWEHPDYQKAQRALKVRLGDLNERYASLLGANPDATAIAVYQERIGMEALTAEGGAKPLPDFQEDFDRVVYFLNRLSSCVESNLCSRATADAYFKDYAVSFWGYFSGYVARERKAGSANFARPIETYVGAGVPADTAAK
jgi:hypothetical protein